MDEAIIGQGVAMLSAICYALSYIFIRKGQAHRKPPDNGLFPILLISCVVLDTASVIYLCVSPEIHQISMSDVLMPSLFAILSGVIGTLFGRQLLYRAIRDLGATRGVVIKGLSPMVTLLIVFLFLDDPIHRGDLFGLLCLVASVLLLYGERKFSSLRGSFPFNLFRNTLFIALLAAIFQGIGHTFRQLSVTDDWSPIVSAALDVTSALLGYVVILLLRGKLRELTKWYAKHISISLLVAGFVSSAGVLLFFVAVNLIPVSTVAILASTEPVIVALLSVLFFPKLERITWWSACAAMVVAFGVLLINV